MIDLHCHILFDTDDGAKTLQNSIEMIKEAEEAGFTKICCTPHYLIPEYAKTKQENLEKLELIKEKLNEYNINVELFLGNEVYITYNICELIKCEKISTINNSKFILIEFPMNFKSVIAENEIDDLIVHGYKVILAHPERYSYVQKDIKYLDNFIQRGVYLQGNYESLIGKYGNNAKKTLIKLLKQEKIDWLSTDVHREKSTYTKMNKILRVLRKYVNEQYFLDITEGNQTYIVSI